MACLLRLARTCLESCLTDFADTYCSGDGGNTCADGDTCFSECRTGDCLKNHCK